MTRPLFETARLIVRRWREDDRPPLAALHADAHVMRYFPAALTAAESDAFIDRQEARFDADGTGLAAVERKADNALMGAVGVIWATFEAPFTPAVEIGWRLHSPYWGQGYATEAARAALAHAFGPLDFDEIVSFTAAVNGPSRRVMERIGMTRDRSCDFDHPGSPPGSPLRPHVLYRISRPRADRPA